MSEYLLRNSYYINKKAVHGFLMDSIDWISVAGSWTTLIQEEKGSWKMLHVHTTIVWLILKLRIRFWKAFVFLSGLKEKTVKQTFDNKQTLEVLHIQRTHFVYLCPRTQTTNVITTERIKLILFTVATSNGSLHYSFTLLAGYINICRLSLGFSRQFRETVKDCKLPESDDSYLIRWLIGKYRVKYFQLSQLS
jgi:hypothetical protein